VSSAMLDALCILLHYAVQGCVQGLAFGTLPLLLRRNTAATDEHSSVFSLVGYPFTLKFLFAPVVDGIYSTRFGRRESWLVPTQLCSAAIFAHLASSLEPMLDETPPRVLLLTALVFMLTVSTAVTDIATDAWASSRMCDSRASVCQSVGLTIGFESSVTFFFFLKGRGLLELRTLLLGVSAVGFGSVGLVAFVRMCEAHPANVEDSEVAGLRVVLRRAWALCAGAPNVRRLLLFRLLVPVVSGFAPLLRARYQAQGFSPEMFAEYDLCFLPLSFLVMWIGGTIASSPYPLTFIRRARLATALIGVASLGHYRCCLAMGELAAHDPMLRITYFCLAKVSDVVGILLFVVGVAFTNRIASRNEAIAGTVITFLASCGNLGELLPETWVPLAAQAFGIELTAVLCLSAGLVVLWAFWEELHRLENIDDIGWKAIQLAHEKCS